MKTGPECLDCYLLQASRVARMVGCDQNRQQEVVREVAAQLPLLDMEESPPANAIRIYRTIAEVTGLDDPYHTLKTAENEKALAALPLLRRELSGVEDPLLTALGFAIAGNVIDHGAMARPDVGDALQRSRDNHYAIDHRSFLVQAIDSLGPGDMILYLADNCGEIVYDSLVVELLAERGFAVTVAVRGGPIINDATMEDGHYVGIANHATLIDNGTQCPGTPLRRCSAEFLAAYESADLIISKGQGNFESLSEEQKEIFFLLTVKCNVVGNHLANLTGLDTQRFPGNGELVVYRSNSI